MVLGKRDIILDSARKLLALNVSDEEILLNLEDIGLSKEESLDIFNEAKGLKVEVKTKEEVQSDSGKIMREVAENLQKSLSIEDDYSKKKREIVAELIGEEEQGLKVLQKKVPDEKPRQTIVLAVPKKEFAETERHANLDKLWEKGILTTVNQRFTEMQKLRGEIDLLIEQKSSEIAEKEIQKTKVLFDSQKTLLLGRIDSALEQKSSEITQIIDSKILEMKKLNDETKKNIVALDQRKVSYDSTVSAFESKLSELQAIKQKAVSELNSETIKYKSKMQEFLDNAEVKIREVDERVSRTLELESKIAEGLVNDAQEKISELASLAVEEMKAELEPQLEEMRTISEKLNVEKIEGKISEIEYYKKELLQNFGEDAIQAVEAKVLPLEKKLNSRISDFEKIKSDVSASVAKVAELKLQEIDEEHKSLSESIDKKFAQKASELDLLEQNFNKSIDLKAAKSMMADLESFKKQFIQTIELNVKKYNESIKELSAKTKKLEEQINLRLKTIDDKIVELDAFEQKFSEEMSTLVEELSKK